MSDNKTADHILQAYQTLGLRPGQDARQVRQAYHTLARALHPDRTPDAQVLMARINQAYSVLNAHFKNQKPEDDNAWFLPLNRLTSKINSTFSSWIRSGKAPPPPAEDSAIQLPEALSEENHWVLLGINQDGPKLVYKVEISGNPKALALPLRRRRPCRVCQGSGKLWQRGESSICNNCAGRGYITKPASLSVVLPEKWHNAQRLPVESSSLSVPLEIELHRPANASGDFDTKV